MTTPFSPPLRSWLFVPADVPRRVAKALTLAADAVVIDLEDAVAPQAKAEARAALGGYFPAVQSGAQGSGPEIYIRVNATGTAWLQADLQAALAVAPRGILLPKAETTADIAIADWAIT